MSASPKSSWKSVVFRYSLPVLTIMGALFAQGFLQKVLPHNIDFPFAFFYLIGAFVSAWLGGYGPGILTCLLIMLGLPLTAEHFVRVPPIDLSRVTLLIGISLLISRTAQIQRAARKALGIANEDLDRRVQGRTEELTLAITALQTEVMQHKKTENRLKSQVERLNLLDQITRAIGERQDLRSVYQVVVRTLEDSLPIDFACICLYNSEAEELTVTCIGLRSEALAMELALTEKARIKVDQNGLARCVGGQLVYEPDIIDSEFTFPRLLSSGGLRSFVAAPLSSESNIFGVLISARQQENAFSSGDCEFLRQLSEHVALAARQSDIYAALQRAYEDLHQTQQAVMQQERLRALGQMSSGIAHDINNALSPMALYTESLLEREPNLSPRVREYLETAQRAIDDVAHTVGRMREFSRKREPQLALLPVDMNLLVRQVLDLTRARWRDMPLQRGVTIHLQMDMAPNLPAVAGIESEIREALINLVFNAVDAMPGGGTLTLRTKAVGRAASGMHAKNVHLEVTDTGVGMDEATRRRCQEPFFTTKGERGTGLGLAMVYGVAQRQNAELEIESVVGQGTTVRMNFPVTAPVTVERMPLSGYKQTAPPRLKILIVDDDPLIIKSLRDTLEADGHSVQTANGGKEGIEVFQASETGDEQFDVVITDLGMPYVDGRKVANAVKAASPTTPLILLTGWGQRIGSEEAIPPNVDRVLNKPPKTHALRMALSELMAADPVGSR